MVILGLDSSGAACSVAVVADDRLLARRLVPMTRGHAEALVPMIEAALADAETGFASLDRIAVTVGPGSFTGLRTGLAAAKGLALALDRPAVGVTSFEAVAFAVSRDDPAATAPIAVALETKRADLYFQLFDDALDALCPPSVLAPEEAAARCPAGAVRIAGDAADRLEDALAPRAAPPTIVHTGPVDAACVARLAARRDAADAPLRPLYLHRPQARLPAHGGSLRP